MTDINTDRTMRRPLNPTKQKNDDNDLSLKGPNTLSLGDLCKNRIHHGLLLVRFKEATFLSQNGTGFVATIRNGERIIIKDSTTVPEWLPNEPFSAPPQHETFPIANLKDGVMFLAGPEGKAFYHWMHDNLPRLLRARNSDPNLPIIIPNTANFPIPERSDTKYLYIIESLKMLGVDSSLIIPIPADGTYKVQKLHLVASPYIVTDSSPAENHEALLEQLRTQLLEKVRETTDIKTGDLREKILISRQKERSARTITNAEVVEELLQKKGFRIVHLEGMSLGGQIATIANARTIVAPHGGGLFHTLFLQDNSKFIEFFPQGDTPVSPNCWDRILACHKANSRRVAHQIIRCPITNSTKDPSNFQMTVDPSELEALLKAD